MTFKINSNENSCKNTIVVVLLCEVKYTKRRRILMRKLNNPSRNTQLILTTSVCT